MAFQKLTDSRPETSIFGGVSIGVAPFQGNYLGDAYPGLKPWAVF
jgi:hypothetical protein